MKRQKNNYTLVVFISLILFGCEKEVFIEPPESSSVYQYAKYKVDSYPQGALIYLDGRTTGQYTPSLIDGLDPGIHSFGLKRNYYNDTLVSVNASLERTDSVFVDYSKNQKMLGVIKCSSEPAGMKIYFNDVYTGCITPTTFTNLLPNEYQIKYANVGYWDEYDNKVLRSSEVEKSYVVMNDSLDIIQFDTRNSPIFPIVVDPKDPITLVTSVGEDKYGNVWLGTNKDRGLFKYDGKNFSRYRYDFYNPGFVKSDKITDMRNDAENNLWIDFSNGPEKFDGLNWEYYETGMSWGLSVNGLKVAVTTENNGLVTYENGIFSHYLTTNSGIKSGEISAACFDKDGKVWALNNGVCMNVFDGQNWQWLTAANGQIPSDYFSSLQADPDGNLIGVYTKNLVNPYTGSIILTNMMARYENGIWTDVVGITDQGRVYVDRDKKLWYGNKRFVDKNNYESITSIVNWKNIRRITNLSMANYLLNGNTFVDSKGNLWIYGRNSVVLKIKPGRWNK